MLRMFRRAARLMVAAGAVGAFLSPAASLPAQQAPGLLHSIQVTSSQMRLEAMKVEMALLADYATYQLPLTVQVGHECLELRGRVSDEQSRTTALRVARQACYLPVKDAVEVVAPRPAAQPAHVDALRRSARDVIAEALGDRVRKLEVRVSPEGQVTLTGQAASVEDKLAAGKALRGLPGCQAVVNCLSVQTYQQAGHTITLVTRDGQHAVHGVLPATDPPPAPQALAAKEATQAVKGAAPEPLPGAPPARPESQARIELPPPPTPTIPSGLPPAREVYVRLKSANQVHPVVYVAPQSSGYATAPSQPMSVSVVSPPLAAPGYAAQHPTPPATPTVKGRGGLLDRFLALPNAQPEAKPAPPLPSGVQITTANPRPAAPAPVAKAPAAPPCTACASKSDLKWPPAYNVRAETGAAPGERRAVLSHSPAIRLAARPELAAKPAAPATTEPKLAAPAPPPQAVPVRHISPAPTSEPPVVTPAAVRPEARPAPAQPPQASQSTQASPLTPQRIDHHVRKSCGPLVKSVKVEPGEDGRTTVHLKAALGSEQEIISRLMAVPEIAASNLRLQIHLSN